jgi:hypothetical protein
MGKGRGPGIKELLDPTDNTEDPTNDTKQWTIEGTLKETLGADGTTDAGDAMLRGSYEITSPILELKDFIETFKKTQHPRHQTRNNTKNGRQSIWTCPRKESHLSFRQTSRTLKSNPRQPEHNRPPVQRNDTPMKKRHLPLTYGRTKESLLFE